MKAETTPRGRSERPGEEPAEASETATPAEPIDGRSDGVPGDGERPAYRLAPSDPLADVPTEPVPQPPAPVAPPHAQRPAAPAGRRIFPNVSPPHLGLDDRAGRLILSIVLAVLLWFYVTSLENPAQTFVVNDLALDVRSLRSDLKVDSQLPTIDVTVQAPQSVMSTLRPGDVKPYIDLRNLAPGWHTVPVQVQLVGVQPGMASVSVSPTTVNVQLVEQVTRDFQVTADVIGDPAFGHKLDPAQLQPAKVKVTGSAEDLAHIASVVVRVDVDNKSSTQQGTRAPVALDSAGNEVTGVTFNPSTVQVVVPIQTLLNYKSVPVHVPVIGQPATGYRVSSITVDPTNLTICCDPAVLEPVQSLDTAPVVISATTTTVVTTTQVILPARVELYPGQKREVSVSVAVEPMITTLQLSLTPTVEGLAEGESATVTPDRVDVLLSGTFTSVQGLTPSDVHAILNVANQGPGTYEIQPQIIVPQGVTVESATPTKVSVVIVPPTPLPSPTTTRVPTETPHPPTQVPPTATLSPLPSPSDTATPEPSPLPPTATPLPPGPLAPLSLATPPPTVSPSP